MDKQGLQWEKIEQAEEQIDSFDEMDYIEREYVGLQCKWLQKYGMDAQWI